MKKYFLLGFSLAMLFVSCVKDDKPGPPDEPEVTKPTEAQTIKDLSYGAEKMDVYLPAGRTTESTNVLILLHGGAWFEGDKNGDDDPHFKIALEGFKKQYPDWAIFNLNYPLVTISGKNKFPAQENAFKSAIQYIFDRRNEFGISDKWVYAGLSAGAHLALLQGYKYSSPIKPKAIIDFYGPTDITALYNWSDSYTQMGMRILLDGTPTNNSSLYSSSSPINFITAQSPPTLILQGGNDDTVPEAQSLALRDELKAAGVKYEYADYLKEQTHGWSDPAIWTQCFTSIQNFLTANVP